VIVTIEMRSKMDQALGLRKGTFQGLDERTQRPLDLAKKHPVRVMTVSSGKGGVGKSSLVVNLALAFDRAGYRVMIIDADLGLANIDVLLGLTPKHNISNLLDNSKRLAEVLVQGPGNIRILAASSGVQELTRLSHEQKLILLDVFDTLDTEVDILLIDNGAGISDTVLYFNLAAQEKIVVVTPEPTSLTDAYALIKVMYLYHGEKHFRIVCNEIRNETSGKAVFAQLSKVADHFLDGISLQYLGGIPYDVSMHRAIMQQRSLLEAYPDCSAAKAIQQLADRLQRNPPQEMTGNIQFFWKKLLRV